MSIFAFEEYLEHCHRRELDAYVNAGNGRSIHYSAVVNLQPLQSKALARPTSIQPPAIIGDNVIIGPRAHVYAGCEVGANTLIADAAQIREGAKIGTDCVIGHGVTIGYDTKIGSKVKIIDGAYITGLSVIEDGVFIGPGVVFANDKRPQGYEWKADTAGPRICAGAMIGARAYVGPGVTVGENAIVGAGAIVVRDVGPGMVVMSERAK